MRAKGEPSLPGMINNPGTANSRQHLESTAIGNQALVFLYQTHGLSQRCSRLQSKTDNINTGRAHPGADLKAKTRVFGATLGAMPEPGNVINWPALPAQGLRGNTGSHEQGFLLYSQTLSSIHDRVHPSHRDCGF